MVTAASLEQSGSLADPLALFRQGDEAAFAELVRQHQAMVFSVALHSLQNRAAAEELAQDVFLHLYQQRGQMQSPEHVQHWLRRVTSHRCIDESRRRKLRPRVGLEDAPEPVAIGREGDPLLRGRLKRLVSSLPERARMLVILRYQEEMEPAEIAAVMEMPLGTVKSSLHRALAMLRAKLVRQEEER